MTKKNQIKIIASIEARMTSSRLPGKVLMPAFNDITMLEFMIKRVQLSHLIDDIVIATTTKATDDPIIDLCEKLKINYSRGSEEDVLKRVLESHNKMNSDIIVELTGDCPLIDPKVIDEIVNHYLKNNYDYVSNTIFRSYPDGFDVEVFSRKLLESIDKKTSKSYDREHVSSYIYNSKKYSTKGCFSPDELFWPNLRLTLDYYNDYKLISHIINHFFPSQGYSFSINEILKYIKTNKTKIITDENLNID